MTHSMLSNGTTPDLNFISQQLFTAIIWVDDSLTIRGLNAQVEQLLAISRGRLLNQSILSLLAPEEWQQQKAEHSVSDLTVDSNESLDDNTINHTINNEKLDSHYNATLRERFNQAKQYQQPFVNHDRLVDFSMSSGPPVTIDYSVTPVMYEEQDYYIIEMWGKDRQSRITEDQRQQQQYDVARHMLRSVAHEVKNPLAGIRGAAQLLERQFNKFASYSTPQSRDKHQNQDASIPINLSTDVSMLTQKLATYTHIIISETDRLNHLISQLLGSNRPANWQATNLHQVLEHVLTLVRSQYPQISLHRDYDLSLPELIADKDQLIQVFLNLINNACESMSDYLQQCQIEDSDGKNSLGKTQVSEQNHIKKTASIPSSRSYQPKLTIQTRVAFQHTIGSQQHKQVIQIIITDNGGGIAPALMGQIFFPMVTSRAAGTGLGLSIVQDIISRHHGMINVDSQQAIPLSPNDNMTRFTVYLPFSQPAI